MGTEKQCTSNLDLSPRVPLSCCRKRRRISSEATNPPPISKLGDDLLPQILIRLPNLRSACRCKLVCKVWRSLISSPCFNRHFLSHHQNMNQSPMPGNPNELQSIILTFLPAMPKSVGDNLRVMDCFKDLVLCGWFDIDADNGEPARSYFICNPFTKQWIALPLAPKKPESWYRHPAARLVCEPRMSNNLDLGDGQTFVYSEYRFRVVCIYFARGALSQLVDIFCSESGEWIKEAFFLDYHARVGTRSISSCNGEVFWKYIHYIEGGGQGKFAVVGINPFRLDLPPTRIDVSPFHDAGHMWILSRSQGALHAISFRKEIRPFRPIVWRLEEDRKSWRKLCEGLVKNPRCCNYYPTDFFEPFPHPDNPEIIFFQCIGCESSLLSCDLTTEEVEFVAKLEKGPTKHLVKVFKPKISYWPTPIPRYEDLRGLYDGSYSWVQSDSREATIPSSLNNWLSNSFQSLI